MKRLAFFFAAAVGAGILLLAPAESDAASLMVDGPAGASVELSGVPLGELPWDQPRDVGAGPQLLRVRLRAHTDFEMDLSINDEEDVAYVRAELLPVDRNLAAVSSLFLAGLGQHQSGRHMWGWGFMAAQLASATIAVIAEDAFKNHRADFQRAQLAYDNAISEPEFRRQEALMAAAWADMEDAESIRDLALYSTIGLAVLSAAEAWWSIGRALQPRVEVSTTGPGERQFRLGFGGKF